MTSKLRMMFTYLRGWKLERIIIFSDLWKWSHSVLSNSLWPHGLYSPWHSGQNIGVGSLSLLQGKFPTQGLNPGLPHFRQILYLLSHKRSPRILEWIAYPFSRGSSQPRNRTGVFCIAGGFFTNWAIREAPLNMYAHVYILWKWYSVVSKVLCFPRASLIAQLVKNPAAMQEAPVRFLGWEDPLEKG